MEQLNYFDNCILENQWPFWLFISFLLLQFVFLFIFLATFCCVIVKKKEEAPVKKRFQYIVKQRTQSLLSPKHQTPPKVVKSKEKPKKRKGKKQKEMPKQDLETAAYLTETFYPIPLQPRGTNQGTRSSQTEKLPEPILVVRPTSDEKLTPEGEKDRPINFKTAKTIECSPPSPPSKKEQPINEDIHVETYPLITISTGNNAGEIEAVLRQSIRREVKLDYPEEQSKVEEIVRHHKKSE